ncbi:MAG: zinc metalloprotease HtpX [Candidatus Bathyarchaeia archaeon]
MSLVKLRISMMTSLALIIGVSTLFFAFILSIVQALDFLSLLFYVAGFNILQWMISPYLVDMMYRVRPLSREESPELFRMVERLSQKSGMAMPKVMIANIPIPNAFAYGSPIAGTRVAVTTGLLRTLEAEEVEAVIGHELGHIKHKDMQIMTFVSMLPALFYYLGYVLSYQSLVSSRTSRDRERGSGIAVAGALSMALYFIMTLLSLHLSRLREYYADRYSVSIVNDGARKLSEALAKIVTYTGRTSLARHVQGLSGFKTLFIADPDSAGKDTVEIFSYRQTSDQELVQTILSRKPSSLESLVEMFSTHPNIVKRLRALQELR